MDWTFLVALVLLVIPIFDWLVFSILQRATMHSHGMALSERAKVAGILAVVTTLNAIIAANRIFSLHLSQTVILIVLSISLILVSVPNLYWLSLYLRNRVRKE